MALKFPRTLAAGLAGVAILAGCSGYGQPAASPGPAPSTTAPSPAAPAPIAECNAQPERPFPYRVRAWVDPAVDAGGDLHIRDALVLQ